MEKQERLEELCGGSNRAFYLLRLWNETRDNHIRIMFEDNTMLERKFIRKANLEGFSKEAVNFFLENF